MPPRNEVKFAVNITSAEVQRPAAPEDSSRRFYNQFESFLGKRAANGGLGAPELFAVRDLAIVANARLRLELAANEGMRMAEARNLQIGMLTPTQAGELDELRRTEAKWREGAADTAVGLGLGARVRELKERKYIKKILKIESTLEALENEYDYARRVIDEPPTHRWSTPANEARYHSTVDAFNDILPDIELAHEAEIIDEYAVVGRTEMNQSEMRISAQRRIVRYLQTKRKSIETDVRTEGIGEEVDHNFDVDTFFARMEQLSRRTPLEEPKDTQLKDVAVFDIIFYLRAKSRLEEAYLRDRLGLDPDRLAEMYPGFKPIKEGANEHSLETREHRFDYATYPRHSEAAYLSIYYAWAHAQVPLQGQMVYEKSDPLTMPDVLREEVDRADTLPDQNVARETVDTLISLSATLELQGRFEDLLAAKLRVDGERHSSA